MNSAPGKNPTNYVTPLKYVSKLYVNKVPVDNDQIIITKDKVNQNVFFSVLSSCLVFLIMLTRFKQKIIPSIGVKYKLIIAKTITLIPPRIFLDIL